ncbi:hypothetical protein KJ910_01865 [Patescibacteria group bacterium]|nr:hypothetical protein [Patescibacteria group bacterium]MBU1907441.1 hypothetical protein [Patescibacteria group bacterium]
MKYATLMIVMLVTSLASAEERISSEDAALCLAAGYTDFATCATFAAEQRRGGSVTTPAPAPASVSVGVSSSEFASLRNMIEDNQSETDARLSAIEAQNRAKDDELARLRAENERLRAERAEQSVLLERAETQVADSTELLTQSERMYRDLIEQVDDEPAPRRESAPARTSSASDSRSVYGYSNPPPSQGGAGGGFDESPSYNPTPVYSPPPMAYAPSVPVEETIIYLHQPRTVAGMSWDDCVSSHQCMQIYNQSPWPIEIDIGDGSRVVVDQRYGMPDLSAYQTPSGPVTLIPPRSYAYAFLGYPKESVYPRVTAYSVNYGYYVPFKELNMGKKRVYSTALDVRKDMPWNIVTR